jgi:hypothetical protein
VVPPSSERCPVPSGRLCPYRCPYRCPYGRVAPSLGFPCWLRARRWYNLDPRLPTTVYLPTANSPRACRGAGRAYSRARAALQRRAWTCWIGSLCITWRTAEGRAKADTRSQEMNRFCGEFLGSALLDHL